MLPIPTIRVLVESSISVQKVKRADQLFAVPPYVESNESNESNPDIRNFWSDSGFRIQDRSAGIQDGTDAMQQPCQTASNECVESSAVHWHE